MPTIEATSKDGKKIRITAPEGTSQQEMMDRAANLIVGGDSVGAAPPKTLAERASAGATPLTPGGEPVSPLGTAVEAATDPETLLGTAGELAGAASPIPGGAALGAAAGGALGRAGKRVMAGKPVLGEGGGREIAIAGGLQGIGSGVGSALATGATMAKRALTGTGALRETAEATSAREFLEPRLKKTGVTLAMTPAESTSSSFLDLMQDVAQTGFFSRGRMESYFANRREGLKTVSKDLLDEVAPTMAPEQLADMFLQGIQGRNAAEMAVSTGLRKQFEDRAGHIIVQTAKLRRTANDIIASSARRGHVESVREGIPLAESIMDLPPTATIGDLAQLRSALLESKRALQAGERVPLGKLRTADKLIRQVDDLIKANVKDDSVMKLYRESNELVGERKTVVDSPFLRKLVRISDPKMLAQRGGGGGGDALVDQVFKNENMIMATAKALGPQSTEFKQLQRRYLERGMANATDAQGNINGDALIEALAGKGSQSVKRFEAAFPDPAVRSNLLQFGEALRVIQKQEIESGGSGRGLMRWAQGGVVVSALISGGASLGAGALASTVVAPWVAAQMLTRPTTARLLLLAAKTPATSKMAASLVSRIAAEAKSIQEENDIDEFLQMAPAAARGSSQVNEPSIEQLLPTRAEGGPVAQGQPYLVGERGPEIVVPQQSGQVVPTGLAQRLSREYPERAPSASEKEFFRARPEVGGYAAPDRKIVLNPYSSLTADQRASVALNERVRQFLTATNAPLSFETHANQVPGPEYAADPKALQQTIVARILSRDPSAGPYTADQYQAAKSVKRKLTPKH